MDTELDLRQIEKASDSIDRLIESRRSAEHARQAWAESEMRYASRQRGELRQAWCDWHRRQAALFESLAQEHRERLGQLIDEAAR